MGLVSLVFLPHTSHAQTQADYQYCLSVNADNPSNCDSENPANSSSANTTNSSNNGVSSMTSSSYGSDTGSQYTTTNTSASPTATIPPGVVGASPQQGPSAFSSPQLGSGSANSSNSSSNCSGSICTLKNPLNGVNTVSDVVLVFMKIVSYLAVIFGVLMIMWVGLQLVLAQGKPEEIKKRSNELLWVVIGIGIIIGARILVSVVINTLQATGAVNSTITQNAQTTLNKL